MKKNAIPFIFTQIQAAQKGSGRKGIASLQESRGWKKLHSKGITVEPTCRGFLKNLK